MRTGGGALCGNQPVRRVHAIEQASRRWRGGGRDDSARTRRKILISTQVSSKGTNVFVLDTGLDTLHQEFEGDREVENVGSYSNFHPGGVWEDKEEWDLTSENRAWLKDNNDSDGHGSFPVPVTPSPRLARRRRKTSPAHRHALRVDGGGQELWNSPPSQRLRHESTTRRLGGRHRTSPRQSIRPRQKKKSEGSYCC